MGKFQYSPDGLRDFMSHARDTNDPLVIAAADVVEIATGVVGRVQTLVLRHGKELMTMRSGGRSSHPPYSYKYAGGYEDEDRLEATCVAGDAAFAYDAAERLDELCEKLIKELETRINDLNKAPPKEP